MKSKFWTLIFAFCPGASQMYQGYMKRGLSLITMFMLNIFVACLIPLFAVFLAVIYMFNFFDALNLHSSLREHTAAPDDYLIHLSAGSESELRAILGNHRLVGWGLVAAGVLGLYKTFMQDTLQALYWDYPNNMVVEFLYQLSNKLPGIIVCAALVILGVRLVRNPKKSCSNRQMPPIPDEDEE